MKLLTFAALFFLLGLSAHAYPQSHEQICESPQAKELMGNNGTCDVVIVPEKIKSEEGMCIGISDKLTCFVKYEGSDSNATMKILCDDTVEELEAAISKYRVLAIVRMESGKQVFLDSSSEFLQINSNVLNVSIEKENGDIKSQKLELNLGLGTVPILKTHCF